ncbi:hypothetical protein MMC25_003988 [Agyrium rufum]|nr:hypothetical protein [Agyrium rufum]
MGRLGDSDVHAAFVEFRAKETDKCLSAQCIYCESVRAKNTSRQRAHLLECPNYLNAMKEHNPQNPILELAANGTPTPAMKTPKKRDLDAMLKNSTNTPIHDGFQGDAGGSRSFPIPRPTLQRDFQMCVQLNPNISIGPGVWGHRNWQGFISGHWNGRFGKGTVVPGGQDKQLVAQDLSTHVDANFVLQTHDHPPAYIAVRAEGWRVGPREILEKLVDTARSDEVDPTSYSFRLYIHMETGDNRYLHLNTGMWLGSAMRRGTEMIFDAYRVM